jgi:hypothetical protein
VLTSRSALARRGTADIKRDLVAFEREADLAKTAKSVRPTPRETLTAARTGGDLVCEVSMRLVGDRYRLELKGETGDGAVASIGRADLQRIVDLLRTEIGRAEWLTASASASPKPVPLQPAPPASRH